MSKSLVASMQWQQVWQVGFIAILVQLIPLQDYGERSNRVRTEEEVHMERLERKALLEAKIQSAWMDCYKKLEKENEERIPAIERFLGFLEGKLDIAVPPYWEKNLRSAEKIHNGRLIFEAGPGRPFARPTNDFGINMTPGYHVIQSESQWYLESDSKRFSLKTIFESGNFSLGDGNLSSSYVAVSGLDAKTAVLAFCDYAPSPFSLVCIDISGKVLWNSKVNCEPQIEIPDDVTVLRVGIIDPKAEIVTSEYMIIVFGYAWGVVFAEGFEKKSGDAVFRFSTTVDTQKQ